MLDFQSPLPLRRADDILVTQLRHRRISIHAPRGGSDHDKDFVVDASTGISIHAPRGGSDERGIQIGGHAQHFNPRSPRGERLGVLSADRTAIAISIHAPRGGSDFFRVRSGYKYRLFQSTLPAGGATVAIVHTIRQDKKFQSTLPAGGATVFLFTYIQYLDRFQSTLPAGGATGRQITGLLSPTTFQSTLPAGGATWTRFYLGIPSKYFNPRSPRGERPQESLESDMDTTFQSTLPAGGATGYSASGKQATSAFQSTLPAGGATSGKLGVPEQHQRFQSTLPAGGATNTGAYSLTGNQDFNPRSPRGERQQRLPKACGKLVQVPVNVKGTVR